MKSKLILSYGFFLILFSIFSYLFVDPNLIYLKSLYTGFYLNHRTLTALTYLIFIFIFFIYYSIFIKRAREKDFNFKTVILMTSIILLVSYPAMLSYDIFNYVATSKVLYLYHENPYIFKPFEFIGDPILQFTRATNKVALYGPVWILVSSVPYILGFGNFLLTLFNFKLLSVISYLGISYILFKITKSRLAVVIFSLNPLVFIETLVSGHNDLFMMLLSLLSFYFLYKNQKIKSILLLTFSFFIKYSTLFLVPVYLLTLRRKIKDININWGKVYFLSSISMILIFLLSPLREEIYPWYATWFLIFSSVIPNEKTLMYFSFGISVGLMLSYIPYMLFGTYFGPTPILKTIIIVIPTSFSVILVLRRRLWLKIFSWR